MQKAQLTSKRNYFEHMQDSILSKLEAARKELLDLGLRNPLINYKQAKSKGVHVVQEKSINVFDILVRQGKAMSFVGRPAKADGSPELEFEELSDDLLQPSYFDTKLQTPELETSLQHKLLNTYYAAKTSIEEQGVNTLYLSLGMLAWYEADASQEQRYAPLLLIPVTLERSSARERFRVKYSEEEIGHNLSLQAKLKAEFRIDLPDIPNLEELDIKTYFDDVSERIQLQTRWKVLPDQIELGFFSFGKFMIYHDLDNNKWPDESRPTDNRILQSLFRDGFQDMQPTAGDDVFIDHDTKAHELYQVVDADSSQILAMLAVHDGKNLVVQGPPGTGKSQTITNIIANAIGQGKKVLFVAEKMAALEVVKRRMDNIGLGEACLELHSHKANKKELHNELKRVLEIGKPTLHRLQEEVSLLSKHKDELNAYALAVNTPLRKSGLTAHQVFGFLLGINDQTGSEILPKIMLPDIESWNGQRQRQAEAMADRIQARLHDIGVPTKLVFWGTGLRVLLPHEQQDLRTLFEKTFAAIEGLNAKAKEIANAMSMSVPANREETLKLLATLQMAAARPDLYSLSIQNKAWLSQKNEVEELLTTGTSLTTIKGKYASILLPEAWDLNVLEIRQSLNEHGRKWYKFLIGSYKKAVKTLAAVSQVSLPKNIEGKLEYVEAILSAQRLLSTLKEHEGLAKELFGTRFQMQKTEWNSLNKASQYVTEVHQQISAGNYPKTLLDYLVRQEEPSTAKKYHDALMGVLNEHGKYVQQTMDKLQMNERLRFANGTFQHQPFADQLTILAHWTEKFPELQQAIAWNNLVDIARYEALECLTDVSIDWPEAKNRLRLALQKTWYEFLLANAISDYPALRTFERASHEEIIKQFRKLDLLNLQYNRAKAALKHWEELPNITGGGQVLVLKNEFNKKARHLPIRRLMQEAGHAIQAIKPVFMMSPLSIANFLSPGALEFDLVIFDEASQVRPVEAIGALLRGNQLVVVGDTKQLPPTSFFDTVNDDIDDEENVTADIQSILGMCDAQGAPQRMLRWHYRSRHESLITLSNHEFYENRLVVFPSPGSKQSMGLFLHHFKDTVYDRGQSRTNPQEAEIVAEAVMEHARKYPKLSLGVVAFSSSQREAIQDALELKRRATPDLEDFFKTSNEEPFFVKNLENVQGDERDVIFISIGYGRTKEGYVAMSFGPLNNEGGERRLNVLITRAKLRCEVFTNISSADIDISRTQSRGIKALKSFLHFAEHGKLDGPVESGKPFDSPFEEKVAKELIQLGYSVRQQVGSQGFYLDLAIIDPENPGRYLLGIECDGAAYHSARSARDRDRLRQQVLEGIGWRIHRIWSTDWFRNPERELKRVVEAIEKAKQQFYLDDENDEEIIVEKTILREDVTAGKNEVPDYEIALLHPEIASKELHQHTIGKLAGWVEKIVRIESPVHFDEMARRMVEAAGITRIGSRIRNQLELAVRFAEGGGRVTRKGNFLWAPQMQTPELRNRSKLASASKKVKYIPPEEIELAIVKVVQDSIAIEPEAAVGVVSRLFGFSRVTEEMKMELLDAIRNLIALKKIQKDGGVLKLV